MENLGNDISEPQKYKSLWGFIVLKLPSKSCHQWLLKILLWTLLCVLLKNACHAPALRLIHTNNPICLSVFLIIRQNHEQATNQLTNWFSIGYKQIQLLR